MMFQDHVAQVSEWMLSHVPERGSIPATPHVSVRGEHMSNEVVRAEWCGRGVIRVWRDGESTDHKIDKETWVPAWAHKLQHKLDNAKAARKAQVARRKKEAKMVKHFKEGTKMYKDLAEEGPLLAQTSLDLRKCIEAIEVPTDASKQLKAMAREEDHEFRKGLVIDVTEEQWARLGEDVDEVWN